MSSIQESLFDLLFNALLQISVFAIIAAILSRPLVRAKASHRHVFYLAVLGLCLLVPVINTFWRSPSTAIAPEFEPQSALRPEEANHSFWNWQGGSPQHTQFSIAPACQSWIVVGWGMFVLFRLARFSCAAHRVHRLRKDASVLSPVQLGVASQMVGPKSSVALFLSTSIDDPATIGFFRPAIFLPCRVLPALSDQELSAVLAHEYGHIRRKDFAVNTLCELASLPVAWHPGIRYLMGKISQTRELACDEYAAGRLGKRRMYARMLLRLASLCLQAPRGSAVGLGIFDGKNLEDRIMTLTKETPSLSRTAQIGLVAAMSIMFGVGILLAQSTSLQTRAKPASTPEEFAGTWHWMFGDRSFSTMILIQGRSGLTGTVTPSRIALDSEGGLSRADLSENSSPEPITKASLEGSALHITVSDGNEPFEFNMTLTDAKHAEIFPKGAPSNMKPIPAEKVY